jgi:hypothetical protein
MRTGFLTITGWMLLSLGKTPIRASAGGGAGISAFTIFTVGKTHLPTSLEKFTMMI